MDARKVAPQAVRLEDLMSEAMTWAAQKLERRLGRRPDIAVLPDGPYGIPVSD
jgi:hypothetical protein